MTLCAVTGLDHPHALARVVHGKYAGQYDQLLKARADSSRDDILCAQSHGGGPPCEALQDDLAREMRIEEVFAAREGLVKASSGNANGGAVSSLLPGLLNRASAVKVSDAADNAGTGEGFTISTAQG